MGVGARRGWHQGGRSPGLRLRRDPGLGCAQALELGHCKRKAIGLDSESGGRWQENLAPVCTSRSVVPESPLSEGVPCGRKSSSRSARRRAKQKLIYFAANFKIMPGKGLSKMCLGRLKKEYKKLQKTPVEHIRAVPCESNLLEWHYVLDGPKGSPYEGGYYHGLLRFPPAYPFKPPSILMYTPSGRFETNVRICLSMSDFHPESWNPMWSVSSILSGLLSFSESGARLRTTRFIKAGMYLRLTESMH